MNKLIKFWLSIVKAKQLRFAFIQTDRAIYDRVAVLSCSEVLIKVEFPKKIKGKWAIVRETIPRRFIEKARYYQN